MLEKVAEKIKKIPFVLIPIVIVMTVIPLVVHYYGFQAHLSVMSWYVSSDETGDMFNYYKAQCLIAMAAVMIAIIVGGVIFCKKYYFHKALIPLGLYVAFIILSTIFSDYQYFSLNGMDNHFETVYVLLIYCLLATFCFWFVDSEHGVKFLLYCCLLGITVMGMIGILQVTGHDLFATKLGQHLIIPKNLWSTKEIALAFSKKTVYLTLYNPNYVGFYAALVIPVLTGTAIFSKKKILKGIAFVLNCIIFWCLMGSGARNGMIAVAMSLVFMLLLFRKTMRKKWIGFGIMYLSMIAIFFLFNRINEGIVTERLEEGFDIEADTSNKLEDIQTNDDNVIIQYNGNKMYITFEVIGDTSYNISLTDENREEVAKKQEDGDAIKYTIEDKRFPFEVNVGKVGGYFGFAVKIDEKTWCFSNQTGYKGYYFYSPYGKFTKIEVAETAIFTNYGTLASGRGYLWARTIPLLKKYLILGSGPDTFTVVFPQKDYVAAAQMGYDKMTVTKPHDLYLQIGTQTGVLSLIAVLTFNLMYLWECLKTYWKKKPDTMLEYAGMTLMISIIGYLISGIINDSTITVAPIYWCMMGIGLAVNRLVKKQREEIK